MNWLHWLSCSAMTLTQMKSECSSRNKRSNKRRGDKTNNTRQANPVLQSYRCTGWHISSMCCHSRANMANYKKAAPASKSSGRALSFGRRDMSATGRKEEMQPMWWKGSQYERAVTSEADVHVRKPQQIPNQRCESRLEHPGAHCRCAWKCESGFACKQTGEK